MIFRGSGEERLEGVKSRENGRRNGDSKYKQIFLKKLAIKDYREVGQ